MICELCSVLFTHLGKEFGDFLPDFLFGDFRQTALQAVVPAHVEIQRNQRVLDLIALDIHDNHVIQGETALGVESVPAAIRILGVAAVRAFIRYIPNSCTSPRLI